MADFGDFSTDDAYDTEPPDPEQVARRIQELRARFDTLPSWDEVSIEVRIKAIEVARLLLEWLKREGALK